MFINLTLTRAHSSFVKSIIKTIQFTRDVFGWVMDEWVLIHKIQFTLVKCNKGSVLFTKNTTLKYFIKPLFSRQKKFEFYSVNYFYVYLNYNFNKLIVSLSLTIIELL